MKAREVEVKITFKDNFVIPLNQLNEDFEDFLFEFIGDKYGHPPDTVEYDLGDFY